MKFLCLGFVLIVLFGLSKAHYIQYDDEKIVGGETARGRYKYQVSLRIGTAHECGGAILNENWILTAAHCSTRINRIYVGSNLLDKSNVTYQIGKRVQHPDFKPSDSDLALIKTSTPMVFGDSVGKIDLPTADVKAGDSLLATGWGMIKAGGSIPNELKQISVKVLSSTDCNTKTKSTISTLIICTLNSVGNGMCQGDSGGPLVKGGQLQGIVSAVIPCATGAPDLQTRVFSFVSWITKTIKP